ncbi:hypothetical protein AAG570_010846 [Ranatra chinensis]|uniref:Uncharacterized protein n=1 Tax=Ranatra chinensis TaxID=642074 RepID=A0ABD0Z561_9HEMI
MDIDLHSVMSMEILDQEGFIRAQNEEGQKEIGECVREALNSLDIGEMESDTDSLTTSPSHNSLVRNPNRDSDSSFGLHSPDNLVSTSSFEAFQEAWRKVKETGSCDIAQSICLDPDIIDLTLLPPPITPDKDLVPEAEELLSLGLEEFLETTKVVPPPPLTVDPTLSLTSEQISAFIIPPPPPPTEGDDILYQENGLDKADISEPPQRPPKTVHKFPPPLPPRTDFFKNMQTEIDMNVEAIRATTDFSDQLSLAVAQTGRSANITQEMKDILGLELRRLVTSSKLLVRSHRCGGVEAGDYAGNLQTVLSQLRKAVDYGTTMEQAYVIGVLQVVTQVQGIIVAETRDELSLAAERLATALATLIRDCHPPTI